MGKNELPVLSRFEDSLVVRLPSNLPPGHLKLRVADGQERSKPYDLRVKLENWRKPFRSIIGGFALLIFGIGVLGRGAREAVGLRSTHVLARWAQHQVGRSALRRRRSSQYFPSQTVSRAVEVPGRLDPF